MGKQSEILSHSLHLDGEGNRANVIYAVKPLQQYISNKEINPMRERVSLLKGLNILNYRRERSGWRKWQILGSYIRDVYNFNKDEVSELVSCKHFFHTSLSGYMVRD